MDVVTLGETMVLFTPESSGYMRYVHNYSRKFGGCEANLAIGLSRLGHQSGWISKVGDDEFGKGMVSFIRGEGVDTSFVKTDSEAPTGIYFKELRREDDVRVYYYRKGSAASRLTPDDLDEAYIAQAKYLFISGITPALSDSCYETIMESIRLAKKNGLQVVFDPNLRRKLWSEEKARKVLLEIAAKSDIILPGIAEGEFLFGVDAPELIAEQFIELGAALVVLKLGADGAFYMTKEQESKYVPGFYVENVVDPVGAGDGFDAGFLSGLLDGLSLYEATRRANAVGAMVTMINGDSEGVPDKQDLEQFINQPGEDVKR